MNRFRSLSFLDGTFMSNLCKFIDKDKIFSSGFVPLWPIKVTDVGASAVVSQCERQKIPRVTENLI